MIEYLTLTSSLLLNPRFLVMSFFCSKNGMPVFKILHTLIPQNPFQVLLPTSFICWISVHLTDFSYLEYKFFSFSCMPIYPCFLGLESPFRFFRVLNPTWPLFYYLCYLALRKQSVPETVSQSIIKLLIGS